MEAEDGKGKFREDAWCRPGGGGGVSRVLQVLTCAVCSEARVCKTPHSWPFSALTQQGFAACLQALGHALFAGVWAQLISACMVWYLCDGCRLGMLAAGRGRVGEGGRGRVRGVWHHAA